MNTEDEKKIKEVMQKIIERNKKNKDKRETPTKWYLDRLCKRK